MNRRPGFDPSRAWLLWTAVLALASHACGPDGSDTDDGPGLPEGGAAGQHGNGEPGSGRWVVGAGGVHSGGTSATSPDGGGSETGGATSDGDGGASSGGETSSGGTEGSGGSGGDTGSGGEAASGGAASGGTEGTGGMPDPGPVNDCETFIDRTAPGAQRTVPWGFGIATAEARCLRIALGQSVTFEGAFTTHPLGGAGGDQPTPILGDYPSGALEYTVEFNDLGTFGYECLTHSTMRGAVDVVP